MLRRFWSLVRLLGQIATYALGLAVLAGLLLGSASLGLAAAGDALKIGRANAAGDALTSLTASLAKPVLKLANKGAGPALQLQVAAGAPPLTVNAGAGRATNLDADKLDGLDAARFVRSSYVKKRSETISGGTGEIKSVNVACD